MYITVRGDTFDIIALKLYGESKMAVHLMEANPEHIDTLIFDAGVRLNTSELELSNLLTSHLGRLVKIRDKHKAR